ncbi:unnamed protein product [Strongylus vulgaris]|uniref:Dendritic cell-specific transmembrane protein-like domain-containing protein n=1 Tax=Strongylus vulgaris TaxID=40348 RepID=A0A3P7LGW4_STRVU|nr:unnamed protein product [Strongylus vulgaris]
MKKALSVGTETAEDALFFHIETAKKVIKGAKSVKKEISDIRHMKVHYETTGEGAEELTIHKKALSVGTETAEDALFFHIETAKKVIKGAKAVKKEISDIRHMKVHYETAGEGAEDLTVHKQLKKSLLNVVRGYINMFETMQTVIKWIFIPLTLFWPFVSTALFTFKFNYREDFENHYLTEEFEKIDLDMALKGRTKALPLNKDEKILVIACFTPIPISTQMGVQPLLKKKVILSIYYYTNTIQF